MKFYRIFRTSECEGQVETDAQLTVNGGVVADLTGDVTGSVTGNVEGDVTGKLTGDVTGSIAGVAVTSGDGVPDGAAAVGAIYIDIENANIYINTDAAGSWKLITRAD